MLTFQYLPFIGYQQYENQFKAICQDFNIGVTCILVLNLVLHNLYIIQNELSKYQFMNTYRL